MDGLEMKAMKTLTKNHILTTFSGKRDYVEYQRRGPVIASAIQSREDSDSIWRDVYENLKKVTAKVLSGDYTGGHESYKGLMLSLENQFVRA